MPPDTLLDDWLRVHRQLMDAELDLSDLVMRCVQGEATRQELDAARAHLMGLRELCAAIYSKAFPPNPDDVDA